MTDLLSLNANPIYSKNDNIDSLKNMIRDTGENGGWLIFYTHDVTQSPSPYGCRVDQLECLIQFAAKLQIPILTVSDALRKFSATDASSET